MNKYLSLNSYDGTLYGIEPTHFRGYSALELPSDEPLSPGGLSTIRHHWTGGMDNDITSDVFAGTGDRYIAGEYGNIYKNGHASVHQVYKGPHTNITENTNLSGKPYYWDTTNSGQENFTNMDFELIENPEPQRVSKVSRVKTQNPKPQEVFTSVEDLADNSAFYFSVLTLIFVIIVAGFWHDSIRKFIEQYLNSNSNTTWQKCGLYTVGMTVALALFIYFFKVEKLVQ